MRHSPPVQTTWLIRRLRSKIIVLLTWDVVATNTVPAVVAALGSTVRIDSSRVRLSPDTGEIRNSHPIATSSWTRGSRDNDQSATVPCVLVVDRSIPAGSANFIFRCHQTRAGDQTRGASQLAREQHRTIQHPSDRPSRLLY